MIQIEIMLTLSKTDREIETIEARQKGESQIKPSEQLYSKKTVCPTKITEAQNNNNNNTCFKVFESVPNYQKY